MDSQLKQDFEQLSQRLKKSGLSNPELHHFYNLAGRLIEQEHGVQTEHNPCSVESISAAVLQMFTHIPAGSVLNVGMGGYPLVDLKLKQRGYQVIGVEYSETLTHLAAKIYKKAGLAPRIVTADGTRLPFKNESFDAALCSETLEHIPEDQCVLKEIHRVLKPGGQLVVTVPNYASLIDLGPRVLHRIREKSWIMHPSHLREYTYFSAKKLIRPFFNVEHWHPVPFTVKPFADMPLEKLLSLAVHFLPGKLFSLSIAFVLRKKT